MPYNPPHVDAKLGAPMGRTARGKTPNTLWRISVRRVLINRQGYDAGGAYWGFGQKLWFATDGGAWERWFRAPDYAAAKRQANALVSADVLRS